MLRPELLLALGLVNWLVTLIIVESEIAKPIREWVEKWSDHADSVVTAAVPGSQGSIKRRHLWSSTFWYKTGYLVTCHLCAGTWVGLVMGAVLPYRFPGTSGLVGAVLAGLAYKGSGHLTLEVVGRLKGS